jgi:DNA-binding CsgD family transcriptional regulator
MGRLSEATALLGDIEPAEEGVTVIRFHLRVARLALAVGDLPAAEAAVAAALAKTGVGNHSGDDSWVFLQAAEVSLAGDRIGEARQRVDQARQLLLEQGSSLERLEAATLGVHIEAEAARRGARQAVGSVRRAATFIAEARQVTSALVDDGGKLPPAPAARLALANAEATTAAGKPAPDAWAAAIDKLDAVSLVLEAARARLGHAEAILASRGSRHDATRLVAQARAVAESAGAKPLLDEADRLVTRARLDLGFAPQPAPATVKPANRYGLTTRETEVLAHLAAGRTNRQIAATLFISEKTASVHVSNLLRKLGVTTRIEAGAIGQHLGFP